MPVITIINDTQVPLHISLRHISPIHFQNNIRPGASAIFHPGRVWFTIEARIARGGKENNEYTLVESVAAPVAVSLCALSLGAGAVWVAGAATAAGGVGAAITSISARIGATAAAQAPTARRLYKYARQGQRIVQVGEVLGIGGGALLGKKAAEAQQKGAGAAKSELERKQTEKGKGKSTSKSWLAWDENARVKEAKKVLKGLLEGSVVSSSGWYMNKERTISIRGGPRATEVDGLLVIETDTLEPFEVVSEDLVDGDGKAAFGDGTGEGSLKTWLTSLSQRTKDKGREGGGGNEISDSQTSFVGLTALGQGEEKATISAEETTYQKHQRQLYDKLNESTQWIYSRIRRGPHEPGPSEDADADPDADEEVESTPPAVAADASPDTAVVSRDAVSRDAAPSPAPPPDDDPAMPPTLDKVLQEIGFNEEQIAQAKEAVGPLPSSLDKEEERKSKVEEAILLLLGDEVAKATEAEQDGDTKEPGQSTDQMAIIQEKPLPEVVGVEKVTRPHWTTKARQAVEGSGAIKIIQVGSSHLLDRGERWLQKGDGKK